MLRVQVQSILRVWNPLVLTRLWKMLVFGKRVKAAVETADCLHPEGKLPGRFSSSSCLCFRTDGIQRDSILSPPAGEREGKHPCICLDLYPALT